VQQLISCDVTKLSGPGSQKRYRIVQSPQTAGLNTCRKSVSPRSRLQSRPKARSTRKLSRAAISKLKIAFPLIIQHPGKYQD
jgi:hypothetical protein